MIRIASIIIAALACASCVSVLPKAPPAASRFVITDIVAEPAGDAVVWTLGVDEPTSTNAYDTAKIALSRAPGAIEYFGGGEWADRAPRMFGAALVRSFENSGRITGVGARSVLPSSTYVLQTDIRTFGADLTGDDVIARVEVYARLTNGRSKILAARLFRAESVAADDDARAVAAALNENAGDIVATIISWTFEEAEKVEAAKK